MWGRMCMLGVVAATAAVQCLPALPADGVLLAAGTGVPLLAASLLRAGRHASDGLPGLVWRGLGIVGCVLLAAAWSLWQAQARLDDGLSAEHDDQVSRVVLRVAELVREAPDSRRFAAQVLSARMAGVPSRIEVSWHGPVFGGPYGHRGPPQPFPEIVPGQLWRMSLNLRRVSGAHNPQGFDYEGHQFARGIRALGSVRGKPELLEAADIDSLSTLAERLRHRLRAAMRPYLGELPYAGVLLALTLGDQASIPAEQWEIFNRSGLTHLVSISGSHITMIAALGAWLANALWRRLSWRGRPCAERLPAQIVACAAALALAWGYCLLAGWGVPARRTFLMLAVVALAYAARLPVSASRLLCLVAALVVLLDPWAVLASGFWLSFGAVAVLFSFGAGSGQALMIPSRGAAGTAPPAGLKGWLGARLRRLAPACRQAARLQLAISLALLPLLALLFNQLSLASPLANAYAIPLIGMVVTPLALLAGLAALTPGLESACGWLVWAAHGVLALLMPFTRWLAGLPWAVADAATPPAHWLLLALGGLAVALLPRGWPWRHGAWLALLPGLCWRPEPLTHGQWRMTALDVGQGGAWVVQTASQALVFDTGPRYGAAADAGGRIVLPYLRASGIGRVDVLVVSHADMDHVGGVRSLLAAMPVRRAYTSFDLPGFLRRESRLLQETPPPLPQRTERCEQGRGWQVDGVDFQFLWPLAGAGGGPGANDSKARNAHSCVLLVRGAHHAALLPGDVSSQEEARMLALGLVPEVDVMMAAHHGSRHSSSAGWVAATQAALVVAQAGRWNRYGHPHADARQRWHRQGATFASTSEAGAVLMHSMPLGLHWAQQRRLRQRYWHGL